MDRLAAISSYVAVLEEAAENTPFLTVMEYKGTVAALRTAIKAEQADRAIVSVAMENARRELATEIEERAARETTGPVVGHHDCPSCGLSHETYSAPAAGTGGCPSCGRPAPATYAPCHCLAYRFDPIAVTWESLICPSCPHMRHPGTVCGPLDIDGCNCEMPAPPAIYVPGERRTAPAAGTGG